MTTVEDAPSGRGVAIEVLPPSPPGGRAWRSGACAVLAAAALASWTLTCSPRESTAPAASSQASAEPEDRSEAGGDPEKRTQWEDHSVSPHAELSTHQGLIESLRQHYSPADGRGVARLLESTEVEAGGLGRWSIEYTAAEPGIAVGGTLFFQVSPFWRWSGPQDRYPDQRGYTRMETGAGGVELEVEASPGQGLMMATIRGRPLQPGETIRIDYGAGEGLAVADSWAEGKEFFYLWVDGDGDGTRKLLDQDVEISVAPGPASDLVLTLPTTARPGATVPLSIAFLDRFANAAPDFEGEVSLSAPDGLVVPAAVTFTAEDRGSKRVDVVASEQGIFQVEAEVEGARRSSNPMWVDEIVPRIAWADLHGHSTYSDGSATPAEYYRYARDVAGLDVAVLTDHDHFGMRKLDSEPALWEHIRQVSEEYHEPGRFVTLLGYEWTSWLYGHRHVLYFSGSGEVLSSVSPQSDTPAELWALLAGRRDVLTIAHHPGGGPVPMDWTFAPPPDLEPVVEIVSVHGTSESPGAPMRIRRAVSGAFATDALDRGYRLGFVGSGDSHDGHPGLAHRNAPTGGLAGLLTEDLTREGVLKALRDRRVFATSGPRLLVIQRIDEVLMGGTYSLAAHSEPPTLWIRALGTAPLRSVTWIKNGQPHTRWDASGAPYVILRVPEPELGAGDYCYVRIEQEDGALAWSSPIWIEP